MKRVVFIFVVGIVPLWFACNDDDDDDTPVNIPSVEVGDTFSLKFGECVSIDGKLLCFEAINDQRCLFEDCKFRCDFRERFKKATVLLSWNGNSQVKFSLSLLSCPGAFISLQHCDTTDSSIYCNVIDTVGYRFYLIDVQPYPTSSNYPIADEQYYITLTISVP